MSSSGKKRAQYLWGLAITLFFLLLAISSPRVVEERVESPLIDLRFFIRDRLNPPSVAKDILIVAIDEASLDEIGRWPWSRTVQADLMERILSGNPSVLAVDIFYGEGETREADEGLGRVIEEYGEKIILAAAFDSDVGKGETVPDFLTKSALPWITHQSRLKYAVHVRNFTSSLPEIYDNARLGHVYSPPDLDGTLRWECLYVEYQGELYPSLSLVAAAKAAGRQLKDIRVDAGRAVYMGDMSIPTDIHGRVRINYAGGKGAFRKISAGKILRGEIDPATFSRKIVILGTTATSTYDAKVTPLSVDMPGVEKNASVMSSILRRNFVEDVPLPLEALVIIIGGVALSLLLQRTGSLAGIGLSLFSLLLFLSVNVYLFVFQDINLNFLYPFSTLFTIFSFSTAYQYLVEEKKSRELKRIFSNYLSPKIIAQLLGRPEGAGLAGRRMDVSMLFADIKGFTSFAERKEPEEVVSHLNEYLKEMTEVIFKWDGTLDKFVGDGIMVFWGAPVEQPDHPYLALMCAIEMSKKMDQLKKRWEASGRETFDFGIGINTGSVLVGNIGARGRKMDYTVIGDNVNLCSRVEGLTRDFDTRIIVTEYTYSRLAGSMAPGTDDSHRLEEIGTVKVRGRDRSINIYHVAKEAEPTRSVIGHP